MADASQKLLQLFNLPEILSFGTLYLITKFLLNLDEFYSILAATQHFKLYKSTIMDQFVTFPKGIYRNKKTAEHSKVKKTLSTSCNKVLSFAEAFVTKHTKIVEEMETLSFGGATKGRSLCRGNRNEVCIKSARGLSIRSIERKNNNNRKTMT